MVRRYSTRSRPANGSAAEPTLGRAPHRADPDPRLSARIDTIVAAVREPGRMVLVSGGLSSGKSAACEDIADRLSQETAVLRFGATQSDNAYTDILETILEHYGFEIRPHADAQALTELIAHEARDAADLERRCVIVLDDAHALPLGDLEALCSLIPGSALSLALAGPDSLAPLLERLAHIHGADLTILPLSHDPSTEVPPANTAPPRKPSLMGERLGGSRQRGDRARTEGRARQGDRGSGSRLDDWLEKLTVAITSRRGAPTTNATEPVTSETQVPAFPMRHLVVLAVVLTAMVGAWIVDRYTEESTLGAGSGERIVELPMPPISAPDDATGTRSAAGANNADGSDAFGAEPNSLSTETSSTEKVPALPSAPQPIISRQGSAADQGTRAAAPKPSETQTTTPIATGRADQGPNTASIANGATAVNPAPRTAEPKPVAPATTVPRPAATALSAPIAGAQDANWILGQPAGRYTLQLVSLTSVTRVREFINLQSDKGRFAIYRLQRNGQLFHVVVYGSFASKAEADTAAARLPPSVGGVQPWIRTFGQVQESVRSTPQ